MALERRFDNLAVEYGGIPYEETTFVADLPGTDATDVQIVTLVFESASVLKVYVNGGAPVAMLDPGPGGSNLRFGRNADEAAGGDTSYGDQIAYDTALADVDHDAVGEPLAARWGVTWTPIVDPLALFANVWRVSDLSGNIVPDLIGAVDLTKHASTSVVDGAIVSSSIFHTLRFTGAYPIVDATVAFTILFVGGPNVTPADGAILFDQSDDYSTSSGAEMLMFYDWTNFYADAWTNDFAENPFVMVDPVVNDTDTRVWACTYHVNGSGNGQLTLFLNGVAIDDNSSSNHDPLAAPGIVDSSDLVIGGNCRTVGAGVAMGVALTGEQQMAAAVVLGYLA